MANVTIVPAPSDGAKYIDMILDNIEKAQNVTGVLSFDGCRMLQNSVAELRKFFNETTFDKPKVGSAFNILIECAFAQQRKGAYTISRAAEIADARDRLSALIIQRTGPYTDADFNPTGTSSSVSTPAPTTSAPPTPVPVTQQ